MAAQLAGLSEVPVRILELTENEALEAAISENLQREDLNPVEETEATKGRTIIRTIPPTLPSAPLLSLFQANLFR